MRICFVASEMAPYAQTGGLGDAVGALAGALAQRGHDVSVVLPLYRSLISEGIGASGPGAVCTTHLAGADVQGAIRTTDLENGVQLVTVDHRELFDRKHLYGEPAMEYGDNAYRFAFLYQTALQVPKLLGFTADLFHCHDWQGALLPFYARTQLENAPASVLTVHNLGYQGVYDKEVVDQCELGWEGFTPEGFEFWGKTNLLKAGLTTADRLTTVSPQYARDVQTEAAGWGLHGVMQRRARDLDGILNGVDDDVWNPETDRLIRAHYSQQSLEGKALCRQALSEECGWFDPPSGPIFGVVSRLVHQKGTSLLPGLASEIAKADGALVVLGSGDPHEEERLRQMAKAHPDRVHVTFGFDENLAHRILAGADALLMPSRYEPCGLTQLYALRYGTVPIVRATGGLIDTVEPYEPGTNSGTGFAFSGTNDTHDELDALTVAVRQATAVFGRQDAWHALQIRGMQQRFTWDAAAAAYEQTYETASATRSQREPLPWQS